MHRAECTSILHRGCGAVRVVKRLISCPAVFVLWLERCEGLTRKVSSLPTLRAGPLAVAEPTTWTDLLGARAERVPDCSSYLCRIPWIVTAVGCQSTHARLLPY